MFIFTCVTNSNLKWTKIHHSCSSADMKDFGQLSSKTVTEVLMLEMKMAPAAKTYLVSGYPRNMRDVVEYSEKVSRNVYFCCSETQLEKCFVTLRASNVHKPEKLTPRIRNLATRRRWMVPFTLRPLCYRERAPGTQYIGGSVGPRAGLNSVGKKNKFAGTENKSSDSLAAQPLDLSRASIGYPASSPDMNPDS